MATSRICSIPDCGNPHDSHGWCSKHYQRWKRFGCPLTMKGTVERGEPLAFLRAALDGSNHDDCIKWPYAKTRDGYGSVRFRGAPCLAHRVVCELRHGAPPEATSEAAHSCGRGHEGCVNPNHLRWATRTENQRDRVAHQTSNRGQRCHNAKLDETKVREIRARYSAGNVTHADLAIEYGVREAAITSVLRRKNWAYVE